MQFFDQPRKALLSKTRSRVRLLGHGNLLRITRRTQFWDKIAGFPTKRIALRAVYVFITTVCRHHANNKLLRLQV
jgi:hypothetical protein